VKVNNVLQADNWIRGKDINIEAFGAETKKENNIVTDSEGKDYISLDFKLLPQIGLLILKHNNDTISQQLVIVEPNVNFTQEYIAKYKNKTVVAIPDVSELVNIMMALHPDAEGERNMFDTRTIYYKKVKEHLAAYINHPALDTIKKY